MNYEPGFFANTAVTVYALSVYDDTTQFGSFMPITEAIAESMPGIRASDIQLQLHWVQIDNPMEYNRSTASDVQLLVLNHYAHTLVQKVQSDMQDSASMPSNRMLLLDAQPHVCASIGTMLRDAGITRVITKHRQLIYKRASYWKVHDIVAVTEHDRQNKSVMISGLHEPLSVHDESQDTEKCFLVGLDTSNALTSSSYNSKELKMYTRGVWKWLKKPRCIVDYVKYGLKRYTDDVSLLEVASVTREALEKVPEGCTLALNMIGNTGWECVNAYVMGMQVRRADLLAQPVAYTMDERQILVYNVFQ